MSNPICCLSRSRHWGREYSRLHLVPRLIPEQRGLRAISPSAFPAAGSSGRAVFLAEPSNCCFQHDITGLTEPRDHPAALPRQLRAGSLLFTPCLLPELPLGPSLHGKSPFLGGTERPLRGWVRAAVPRRDAGGTGGCASQAGSIIPPQEPD